MDRLDDVVDKAIASVRPGQASVVEVVESIADSTGPDGAVPVLGDRQDLDGPGTLRDAVGDELAALETTHACVGADPQHAGVVGQQRGHVTAGKTVLRRVRRPAFVAHVGETTACSHPDAARRVSGQGKDLIARESGGRRVHGHPAITDDRNARLGADPDPTTVVFVQTPHPIIREPVPGGDVGEATLLVTGQAAGVGADPQRARAVDEQRLDVVALDRRRVEAVERGEPHAVEAHQAFGRREPQIPVWRAGDSHHAVRWQPILILPVDLLVPSQHACRAYRLCVGGCRQQSAHPQQRQDDAECLHLNLGGAGVYHARCHPVPAC